MNKFKKLGAMTGLLVVLNLLNACSNTLPNSLISKAEIIDLYDGEIPGALATANLEYQRDPAAKDTFLMAVTHPNLTAYIANPKVANGTAVIICPGGAYAGVSNVKEGDEIARRFNQIGVSAFVLKYRMPMDVSMQDKSVGPLQDVQQAIHLVRSHSQQWQIDANKIGIMGFSAGGHLASSAAVHYQDAVNPQLKGKNLRPDFQILIYPVISFDEQITHKGSRQNLLGSDFSELQRQYFSNELQVTTETPKAFIVHAQDDEAVLMENAWVYYQALHTQHVPSQLILLPQGGHGFGLRNPIDWFQSLDLWMNSEGLLKR